MWLLTENAGGGSEQGRAHDPRLTDSAGQPWAGRSFDANTFSGDTGEAPERLIEALRRFRAADVGQPEVIEALRDARLLVPLVAHAGEMGEDAHGRLHDKTQELSLVTVSAPDGRLVLPAFTSTAAMARWNPLARPIPTPARRAALAAASEDTPLMVLDPTSDTEFAVRRPMLRAIAEGSAWLHPAEDPDVATRFVASVTDERAVRSLGLADGDPNAKLAGPQLRVELALEPGLDQQSLGELLSRLQARWQQDELLAERVDSLGVRLVTAG